MANVIVGGSLQPNGQNVPTRVGEIVSDYNALAKIPNPRVGMEVWVTSANEAVRILSLKEATIAGVVVPNAVVDRWELVPNRATTTNLANNINEEKQRATLAEGALDTKIDSEIERAGQVETDLLKRIQGTSDNSNAMTDPFKSLGTISNVVLLANKLDSYSTKDYIGKYRIILNYTTSKSVIDLEVIYSNGIVYQIIKGGIEGETTIKNGIYNELYRSFDPETSSWSSWKILSGSALSEQVKNIEQKVVEDSEKIVQLTSSETALRYRIERLEGADTGKSVRAIATELIAEVIDEAPTNLDTLKEIADFITNDKTGAAYISNALNTHTTDIQGLKSSAVDVNSFEVESLTDSLAINFSSISGEGSNIELPKASDKTAGVMSVGDKKTLDSLPVRLGDVNVIELEQSQFSNLIWNGTKFLSANNNFNSYILRIPEQTPLTISSVADRTYWVFKESPYIGYSTQDFIKITNWADYSEGLPIGYGYLVIQLNLSNSSNYDVVVTFGEHGVCKRISTLSKKIDEEIIPMIDKVATYEEEATFNSGYICPTNGGLPITEDSLYVHTIMDCIEGQKFTVSAKATKQVLAWQFLGDSNNIITNYEGGSEPIVEAEIVAPFRAKKILVNSAVSANHSVKFWSSNTPENILLKEIEKVEEKVKAFDSRIVNVENNLDKLRGKTILCLGDSITEFSYDGKRYSDYLAEITGATVYNGGIGGTGISRRSDIPADGAFTSNAQAYACLDLPSIAESLNSGDFSLPQAAAEWLVSDDNPNKTADDNRAVVEVLKNVDLSSVDIVTIFIGTNDIGRALGEPGESIKVTDAAPYPYANVSRGFNRVISQLLLKNPNLRIYYFSPMPRYWGDIRTFDPGSADADSNWCDNYTVSAGYSFPDLVDHLISLARYYKIPVCDMYRTLGINQWNIASIMRGDVSDGTHPYKGFKMIANKIASFIIANNNLNI